MTTESQTIGQETERHNLIFELLDKIRDGSAAETVVVNFNDDLPSRTCKILDLGINHIYLSEGISPVGKKVELDKISEIEWTEQISHTLELK